MLSILKEAVKRLLFQPKPKPKTGKPPNKKTKSDDNCVSGCGKLPVTARKPVRRHNLCLARGKNDRTRGNISSVFDPTVNVGMDIADLNNGRFERVGSDFKVNGRIYGMHDNGTTYPKSGPGIHKLNRLEHQFLRELNGQGLDKAI